MPHPRRRHWKQSHWVGLAGCRYTLGRVSTVFRGEIGEEDDKGHLILTGILTGEWDSSQGGSSRGWGVGPSGGERDGINNAVARRSLMGT